MFEAPSLETVDDLYEGRAEGFLYSRDANPNVAILERVIAQLEDADDSVAFASGMAAIGITILSMVEAGDHILAGSELYGGTNLMLRGHLSRLGVETRFVDTGDLDAVERALDSRPRLILVESITNPLLRLADVESISRMAHRRGVPVVVDNTLASPLLLRPLELGADVSIHSATKTLGGHSDVTGGVAAGRADLTMAIRQANRVWGASLDPFAAWLIVRGIRTLPLRVDRACANALQTARFLSDHPRVGAVHYPGLPGHPQHRLAEETLGGRFGWMVTFELAGGGAAASAFVKALDMIKLAPSLGEARTTVSHPTKTSHRSLTPDERAALGITDGTIRLSCGIESPSDIVADLESALNRA